MAEDSSDAIRGRARGTAPVPLSVLDLVSVGEGRTIRDALDASVRIARIADRRGFARFWVAEHHSMPGVGSSSPAVILAHLAAHTERVRLGSGGVMLPNHAPLIIAEQFGTLEALAPGRIDLGLGRAPGTDGATAAALRRTRDPHAGADTFPQQLAELLRFLDDDFPDGHPYAGIHAVPGPVQGGGAGRPPIWLLGSSGFSAQLAGALGFPFAYAYHFAPTHALAAVDLYRSSFRPSAVLSEPYVVIGAGAVAAEDERTARGQVLTGALSTMHLRAGRPGLVPTPEQAENYPYSRGERTFIEERLNDTVFGTPDTVREGLNALVKRFGADELMLTVIAHTPDDRVRSFELIADAYDMPADARNEDASEAGAR